MATLIDYTYFSGKGLFTVPNIDPDDVRQEGNYFKLNAYIRAYEYALLNMVFGKDLYNALIAGLAVTPTPEARWTTLAGKLRDATNLTSPIANYTYYRLWESTQRHKTESGDVVLTGTGISVEANTQEAVNIYNQMVDMLIEFQDWFTEHTDDYPEWDSTLTMFSFLDKINVFGI